MKREIPDPPRGWGLPGDDIVTLSSLEDRFGLTPPGKVS